MEKTELSQQFAGRLREAMISAGFDSPRSMSGVCIHKLAEISGHSEQICRRYLRGETIPEPMKLLEIAQQLCVSPGWLLFGKDENYSRRTLNDIVINKKLLHYLLSRSATLYHSKEQGEDLSDFLLDLIYNVSQINANEEQSKKIIDLALSSINYFK